MNNQTNGLFEEDYCDGCGNRVKSDTLEENNENWYCQECTRQMDEEGEKRMQEYAQDQMLEEQERESYDDNNPYEGND